MSTASTTARLPIIGVNTFRNPNGTPGRPPVRTGPRHRRGKAVPAGPGARLHRRHRGAAHDALAALQEAARSGDNVFDVLMDAARVCTLQQITDAFFEVGGQYRRNI